MAERFVSIDITQASFDIPASIQRRVGRAIIEFSGLETISELMLFDLLQLDFEDGQTLISRQDATRKFQILKEILDRRCPSGTKWKHRVDHLGRYLRLGRASLSLIRTDSPFYMWCVWCHVYKLQT